MAITSRLHANSPMAPTLDGQRLGATDARPSRLPRTWVAVPKRPLARLPGTTFYPALLSAALSLADNVVLIDAKQIRELIRLKLGVRLINNVVIVIVNDIGI